MKLSPEDKKKIEARIAAAEKKTSGEIVVTSVSSSGGYAWIFWALASLGTLTATIAISVLSLRSWPFSALQLLEWQIVGACVGLGASYLPAVRRLFVSKRTRARKVHRQSLAAFVAQGIAQTQDRTGILVFISEFEHRVEIVADKGIHDKLGQAYWQEQVQHIIQGIRTHRPAEAICEAVDQMGEKLREHFPRTSGDRDELSNRVTDDKD